MDCDHAIRVTRKVEDLIKNESKYLRYRPWVVVHERKISHFDFSLGQRENLGVDEVVVAHIVNLDLAFVVSIEKGDHVILTVSK